MEKDIAIKVDHISKTFRIPHEKVTSLRGAAISVFKKSSYEEFKALENVSFEVKKGEFFGIIGRNGSGKSTLLKILAGIYQPDKGKVHIKGLISPFLELGIGFNPELSGRDNIYLNATVLGLSKKEIDKKFDSIVAFSELERFIDQKLKNYSSGMQVRLAFSVSIHANREILLMDEVLAVGDNNFQSKCLTEFNRYKKMGKTVILVSHDIATVQQYCDRALLLRNGEVIKIGDANEVGNEYVYQNMSDEEKRLLKEQKAQKIKQGEINKEEENETEKVAEITKVEFLNDGEHIKNIFRTGDNILIRIYFKINKSIDEFNFGFGLYNERNQYIFGNNTILDKVNVNKFLERGYIQILFSDIPLKTGKYYIKSSIVKDNFNFLYDFLEQSPYFSIQSTNRNEGILDLDYEWV